jgi:hypothetical protein
MSEYQKQNWLSRTIVISLLSVSNQYSHISEREKPPTTVKNEDSKFLQRSGVFREY